MNISIMLYRLLSTVELKLISERVNVENKDDDDKDGNDDDNMKVVGEDDIDKEDVCGTCEDEICETDAK